MFPERFAKHREAEFKFFLNADKRKKNKKSKKNCDCSENQIEVGINLTENYVESDIIGDRIMFSRNITFDITQIVSDFKRVVKEKEQNDKYNI